MPEHTDAMQEMARQMRIALEANDPSAFGHLLDPDVHWGAPGARRSACNNRDQVLTWYRRATEAGMQGQVSDVVVFGDRLLVSLTVRGTDEAKRRGGAALRWQVLTVRRGRVVDIVGFDDKNDALASTGAPATTE